MVDTPPLPSYIEPEPEAKFSWTDIYRCLPHDKSKARDLLQPLKKRIAFISLQKCVTQARGVRTEHSDDIVMKCSELAFELGLTDGEKLEGWVKPWQALSLNSQS